VDRLYVSLLSVSAQAWPHTATSCFVHNTWSRPKLSLVVLLSRIQAIKHSLPVFILNRASTLMIPRSSIYNEAISYQRGGNDGNHRETATITIDEENNFDV
jgi:hypothetical protein